MNKAYLPIAAPELIEAGPHRGLFAIRYKDEHGLIQTSYPFISDRVALAFAISRHMYYYKSQLVPISVGELRQGDLVLNQSYSLIQITGSARHRDSLFKEKQYCALGVFAQDLTSSARLELVINEAYKIQINNEDLTV